MSNNYTSVDNPEEFFQIMNWTGNSSSTSSSARSVTNDGTHTLNTTSDTAMQPDWVVTKNRDTALSNSFLEYNSNLGPGTGGTETRGLFWSKATASSDDETYGYLSSFDSNGFSFKQGSNSNRWYFDRGEGGGDKYTAYQWKVNGGTTSSNSSGDTTADVQVNTTNGISIATFTAPSGNTSVGHGLGATPDLILIKSDGGGWWMRHPAANWGGQPTHSYLGLHSTAASNNLGANFYADANKVYLKSDFMISGDTTRMYCFKEIQGFSRFYAYEGCGQSNGTFVYTGFKPQFLMYKGNSAGYHWRIKDRERDYLGNPRIQRFGPSASDGDYGGTSGNDYVDFLSNGFKFRSSNSDGNVSSIRYVYWAFAKQPFVTSQGVACTAE